MCVNRNVLVTMVILAVSLIARGDFLGEPARASTSSGTAEVRVDPPNQTVAPGAEFTVTVRQDATVVVTGAQTDVTFDSGFLQIVSVARGEAYTNSNMLIGVAPQTPGEAIAEANSSGTLQNVGLLFFPGTDSVPPGDAEFLVITMQAGSGGTSPIVLSQIEMIDDQGREIYDIPAVNGSVTVGAPPAIAGDATCDGSVEIADLQALLVWLGEVGNEPECLARANTDCTGEVDMTDLRHLLFHLADLDLTPPGGCPLIGTPIEN